MALTISTPPQGSLQALQAGAAEFSGVADITGAAGSARAEGMLPHKIFTIGLTDLVDKSWVGKTRMVGWRYLIQRPDGVALSAEVEASSSGEHRLSQLNEGPFVEQTAELASDARSSQRVENGSYELAVLRIPAIYVMALWLKSQGGGDDIIIPMAPTLDELEPGREYGIDEITPILVAAARERLEFDDAPQK